MPHDTPSQPAAFTLPIEPLGFAPPGAAYLGSRFAQVALVYLDESHLLVTFRIPGLIHRSAPSTGAAMGEEHHVRAVVLELPSGKVQAEAIWTLHDHAAYLWGLGDGRFLLRDRDALSTGDATLRLSPMLHFPGPVESVEFDPDRRWLVTVSLEPGPASASPSAQSGNAQPNAHLHDQSGDRSNATEVVREPVPGAFSGSTGQREAIGQPPKPFVLRIFAMDSRQVMLVSRAPDLVHLPLDEEGYIEPLRGRAAHWILNLSYFRGGSTLVGDVESECAPSLDMLASQVVLATVCGSDGNGHLVGLSTAGKWLWDEAVPATHVWPLLALSANHARFARETFVASREVNSFNPLDLTDIRAQIVQVYDVASGKLRLTAAAYPYYDGGGNYALSPSGRQAVVIHGADLEFFALPEPDAPPQASATADARKGAK